MPFAAREPSTARALTIHISSKVIATVTTRLGHGLKRTALTAAAACVAALALGAGLLLVLSARDAATTQTTAGPGTVVPAQHGSDGRALRAGNVILMAGRGRLQEARALARALAGGRATGALRMAGQAVIVHPRRSDGGIVAVAWRRELPAERADEPALAAFVEHWLGRSGS